MHLFREKCKIEWSGKFFQKSNCLNHLHKWMNEKKNYRPWKCLDTNSYRWCKYFTLNNYFKRSFFRKMFLTLFIFCEINEIIIWIPLSVDYTRLSQQQLPLFEVWRLSSLRFVVNFLASLIQSSWQNTGYF